MRTVTDISGEWKGGADYDPRGIRIVETPGQGLVDMRIPVEDPVLLGREPGPKGIALKDPRVSGLHLTIFPGEGGALLFRDMGSKNGTFHNGRRSPAGVLDEGDVLRLGSTMLVVTRRGPASDYEDEGDGRIGQSPRFREAGNRAGEAAVSKVPVLIIGETGTGKEGTARFVHQASGRRGPFIAVNCAALGGELANASLFGHEKGAYTGATSTRRGFFREADGGTLFLDEIGDLPLEVQPRLLRALEQYEITPVGASRPSRVDVRVVAATNVDLADAVAKGTFRGDLYARLNAWTIELPKLSDRREDILRLARFFAGRPPEKVPYQQTLFEADLAEILLLYDWPFNVRELRQVVDRLAVDGAPFAFDRLPRKLVDAATSGSDAGPHAEPPLDDPMRTTLTQDRPPALTPPSARRRRGRPDRDQLELALDEHGWNISAVARHFERDRKQIYRWLTYYGIALIEDAQDP